MVCRLGRTRDVTGHFGTDLSCPRRNYPFVIRARLAMTPVSGVDTSLLVPAQLQDGNLPLLPTQDAQ